MTIINGLFDGDPLRPYLPAINPNITDTRGRRWPGNPGESKGVQVTECWDDKQVRVVGAGVGCVGLGARV